MRGRGPSGVFSTSAGSAIRARPAYLGVVSFCGGASGDGTGTIPGSVGGGNAAVLDCAGLGVARIVGCGTSITTTDCPALGLPRKVTATAPTTSATNSTSQASASTRGAL